MVKLAEKLSLETLASRFVGVPKMSHQGHRIYKRWELQ